MSSVFSENDMTFTLISGKDTWTRKGGRGLMFFYIAFPWSYGHAFDQILSFLIFVVYNALDMHLL